MSEGEESAAHVLAPKVLTELSPRQHSGRAHNQQGDLSKSVHFFKGLREVR